jgi:CubicO group peptidase (beta-lactamase class C family)
MAMAEQPDDLGDGWPVGDPARHGLDPALLGDMRARIEDGRLDNVHAVLLVRHGTLVFEQYRAGQDQNARDPPCHTRFDATTRHNGNSMTKSVTALLLGIGLQRGWIETLDTPVLAHFPEYPDLRGPARDRITLRHLLAMSDGLEWAEFTPPQDSMQRMFAAPDPWRFMLDRPIAAPPGRTFNYNSAATELLGAILHRRTGTPIDVLARQALFEPLGIADVEWNRRLPDGSPMACSALRARPRDWAKLGELVLRQGAWQGRQVVPAAWIAESTRPQNNGPFQFLYGYHWWLGRSFCGGRVLDWVGAMGWGGQRLIIVPALDLVLLVHAWLPNRMNLPEAILLNQFVLPATAAGG